jgi:hypothetical protein
MATTGNSFFWLADFRINMLHYISIS